MAYLMGFAFPFSGNGISFPAAATDDSCIKDDAIQCLLTRKGEYYMNPLIGSALQDVVFENTGPLLVQRVRTTVLSALTKWVPAMIIQSINVVESASDSTLPTSMNVVTITINYILASNSQQSSLTFSLNGK